MDGRCRRIRLQRAECRVDVAVAQDSYVIVEENSEGVFVAAFPPCPAAKLRRALSTSW